MYRCCVTQPLSVLKVAYLRPVRILSPLHPSLCMPKTKQAEAAEQNSRRSKKRTISICSLMQHVLRVCIHEYTDDECYGRQVSVCNRPLLVLMLPHPISKVTRVSSTVSGSQ
jgi:hypothetical protein